MKYVKHRYGLTPKPQKFHDKSTILSKKAMVLRNAADLARLGAGDRPVVLAITHSLGGGVQKHIDELAKLLVGKAYHLLIRPAGGTSMDLIWNQPGEALSITFDIEKDYELMVELYYAIGIARIHFHHLLDVPPRLIGIARDLDVPYDFTVHDYYSICPQVNLTRTGSVYQGGKKIWRYCNELGEHDCHRCLKESPAPGNVDIATWRARNGKFLEGAERVFAPSMDTADRFLRYFSSIKIQPAWHWEAEEFVLPAPRPLSRDVPLNIGVIGELSPIKGADILEACAQDAKNRGLPLRFDLIGDAYRSLKQAPKTNLKVHEPYDNENLRALFSEVSPHLIWFPALAPETYGYTLSSALAAGLPVAVPNIGSFKERVSGRPWSWVVQWNRDPELINDWFVGVRQQHFVTGVAPPVTIGKATRPSFNYANHYLNGVGLRKGAHHEDLQQLAIRLLTINTPKTRSRKRILYYLSRMRAMAAFRWATQTIPMSWQRRVKNWIKSTQ